MSTIGENLWGTQKVFGRDLKGIVCESHLRNVLGFCLFAVSFYFAYRYGMAFSYETASPFWFPDSVLLCALLLVRPRWWWVFVLAALPIRLLLSVPEGVPLWFLLATFANDSAKGLIVAAALRRFLRNPVRFETVRDFVLYCLFAVLLVPAASAFGGAAARYFLGSDFWLAWEQWFLGDALTHLVVTPVIFYWVLGAPWNAPVRFGRRWGEGALLAAGLLVTAYIAFDTEGGATGFTEPRFYAPVPFLFWAAIRFGMFGATGATAVIAFFSIAAALQGQGPFSGQSPADTALDLQHFLLLRAAPLYLVAVLIEQKEGVEHSLHERVKELTALHRAARILQNEQQMTSEWLQQLVDILPPAWQYPETTAARIRLEELEFATPNFKPTPWIQRADFSLGGGPRGTVEVVYLGERPAEQDGPFLAEERNLIDSLAEMLRTALERRRAEQTLRENETALRASYDRIQDLAGRLITAQEAERSRIASDLHDDINQQLAGLSIALSNVKRRLQNGGDATVQEELTRLQQRTIDLADMIRNLSHELHPGVLQHAGLVAALRGHCAEFGRQHSIEVTLSAADGLDGISYDVALCLYRVAQEALRNTAEHAGAGKARVALNSTEDGLELVIADDGQGFNLAEAEGRGGLGLISLDERVRLIGGSLAISTEPQHGTEVRVQVPLGGNDEKLRILRNRS